ncbi:iron ABC transporter permease [Kineococcus endophyticus]|uniref:Iron ABC transporter permease n=1 Tax=Kineococcus endophyticus TaxID=1181883 RepID=A0ABV3PC83_9ACTN
MSAPVLAPPPVRPRGRSALRLVVWVVLLVAVLVGCVAAIALGERVLAPADVLAALTGSASPGLEFLVLELRAPRAVTAVLVGAALGASGAVTQSLLRNPLASPDIVGVTAGASCAVVVGLLGVGGLGGAVAAAGPVAAAAVGAAAAAAVVLLLAWKDGITARRVVLVGLGVNAGLGAATSWTLLRADLPDLGQALRWLTGSLNDVDPDRLPTVAAVVGVALVLLAASARTLDVLRLDDVTAAALGVRVGRARVLLLALAVVLAAAATAVAGPVGFVAFAAPQLAQVVFRTAGPPVGGATVVGALAVLLADLVARTAFPQPVPVGLVTAAAGAPLLLWLLVRNR